MNKRDEVGTKETPPIPPYPDWLSPESGAAPAAKGRRRRRVQKHPPKRGLTEEEAAYYIGMSRSYLRQDRMNGRRETRTPGPRWVRIGRAIRYLKDDLDSWLEQYRVDISPPDAA